VAIVWARPTKFGKMELYKMEKITDLLPADGIAEYYGPVVPGKEAAAYFEKLLKEIEWKNDEALIFGRHYVTKRKAAWYGDQGFLYTYSNRTKHALPWTNSLLELKSLIESLLGVAFNSCLLNLYHDGNEGMAWHSDDEKSLAKNGVIASVSFGAERKFSFRHKKTKESVSLILEDGSLLVMRGGTQVNWLHRLPKSKKILTPRINLTFRIMVHQ
jgi:alkylated DNA repair dioxygenase AlkB